MKQKTAVEWLVSQLNKQGFAQVVTDEEIQQAKEIEKQQIIDCSIETTQDCFTSIMEHFGKEIVFTKQDLINQRNEAEEYYNEKFNKDEQI